MVRVVWMMVSACKTGRRAHNTRHTAFPENGPTFPENVNASHPQGRATGLQILHPRPPAVVARPRERRGFDPQGGPGLQILQTLEEDQAPPASQTTDRN